MRGSVDGDKKGAHIVSAICRSHSLVIGHVKVNEKTNEIKAIPDLLDMLYIKDCIVTIDAMGCQKAIAEKIIDCKADYVLNVKGNQESLKSDIIACFEEEVMVKRMETLKQENKGIKKPAGDATLSMIRTTDFGHGRIEKRTYWYTQAIDWMLDAKKDWKKLAGVGMVMRETEIGEIKTSETSYFIGSINDIKNFEKAVRNHWQIESMHWVLDVVYKDDANRTRKCTAPQNMAVLKKVALNAVKKDTHIAGKLSVKGRRFKAAHDLNYLDYIVKLNFID
jgi:predicted transposase YbfD/YdcC